jgi:hypothetical protein
MLKKPKGEIFENEVAQRKEQKELEEKKGKGEKQVDDQSPT